MTPGSMGDHDVTRLLKDLSGGDDRLVDQLMPLVYDTLRAIAGRQMKEERASHTLEPTALVHEAYLRLVGEKQVEWKNRAQFYAIASRCVRQVLINHANAKHAAKRAPFVTRPHA